MTAHQRLNLINIKHGLICAAIIFSIVILFMGFAAWLIYSFVGESRAPDIKIALICAAIFFPVFSYIIKNDVVLFYLRIRKILYKETDFQTKDIGKIIASILFEKDIEHVSQDKEKVFVIFWETDSICKMRYLTHISLRSQPGRLIDLTKDESSRIILALSPKSGSWAFAFHANLDFITSLRTLSAHEKMMIHKQRLS